MIFFIQLPVRNKVYYWHSSQSNVGSLKCESANSLHNTASSWNVGQILSLTIHSKCYSHTRSAERCFDVFSLQMILIHIEHDRLLKSACVTTWQTFLVTYISKGYVGRELGVFKKLSNVKYFKCLSNFKCKWILWILLLKTYCVHILMHVSCLTCFVWFLDI